MVLTSDESLGWMSRCASNVVFTGIKSIDVIRDVSSHLVPIKRTDLESSYEMTKETSQFTQFANSQALHVFELLNSLEPKINKLVSCQLDEILLLMTNVTMGALREKIEHRNIAHGQNFHLQLCSVYDNVTSPSRSDLEQFVDCIRDMAKLSASPSHFSDADFQIDELRIIALELMRTYRIDSITATDLESLTPKITAVASKIEIGTIMTTFSDSLCDTMNVFSQNSTTDGDVCDDVQMLEATNEVLTSVWSEVIRGMLQNKIVLSLMIDIRKKTEELFELEFRTLLELMRYFGRDEFIESHKTRAKQEQRSSNRLSELFIQMMESRGPHVRLKVDARIICKRNACDIIILDVDRETILTIPSYVTHDSIKLIYIPPCPAYPGGHFDAYVRGEVVEAPIWDTDDYDLFHPAVNVASRNRYAGISKLKIYIKDHPSVVGRLLTSGEHAYQLKRGRALLRLDMNHPTRQMNQCEHVELNSPHLSSCIEQALKSENVSQLAKVLAEYESESRSAKTNSPKHGTELMTSTVSRDVCELFLSSGSSAEAEIYRQLVVERINDGDITSTLKLCCIAHQIPFFREIITINLQISDAQTFRDTFEQMLKIESYEQEISKFQSICDDWYRVLEPHGLMNIENRELLREWISTRQYAKTEDPIVSLVIEECSKPKKEEEEKKWQEAKKMRKEIWKKIEEKEAERKLQQQEEMREVEIRKKINEIKEVRRKLQEAKKMRDD